MLEDDRWLLPEGIEELLPPQAAQLEALNRRLLDLFRSWGYELVMPPFIEFLESLLTGTGNDLDLETFKLTDQLTGRLMGVRSDMTPQVARIDAHHLRRTVPTRLCYMGTVLRTRPRGHGGTRSPYQAGVELYGHAGLESDVEVLRLMIETLRLAKVEQLHIDLGHVGVFRGLARMAELDAEAETALFDALQRKAIPEVRDMLGPRTLKPQVRQMLLSLADLHGGAEILEEAAKTLAAADNDVLSALDTLRQVAEVVETAPGLHLHFDLAELRGYHYHTGLVFAAFVPGQGQAVAQGGRYDGIARVFGPARPATGFSTDLRALLMLTPHETPAAHGIFAPWDEGEPLRRRIAELRSQGERVVQALPGQEGGAAEMDCDRLLVRQGEGWEVQQL